MKHIDLFVTKTGSPLFFCVEQEPKPNELGLCALSVQHNDIALLLDKNGKGAIRRMDRARVDSIQVDGIRISGYEQIKESKNGKPIYRYQEWFCRFYE